MSANVSRKDFVKGAGAMALAGTALGAQAALASESADGQWWLPASWDYETDIAVIGFGGAGAAAAITAANEELGECLVIDVAPEQYAGGNTSVSGQQFWIPDPEDPLTYQRNLNWEYPVEEELMEAWAQMMVENGEWLEDLGYEWKRVNIGDPEFPGIEGYGNSQVCCIDGKPHHQTLWNALMEVCDDLGVEVLYETRATSIVRNPQTNEALGVIADQNGTPVAIKARKGVIVACGGFEANKEMMAQYYESGMPRVGIFGTPYNRGDGFGLVKPFGAQTWHENNVLTYRIGRLSCADAIDGQAILTDNQVPTMFTTAAFGSKDFIQVGADGRRYMYEEVLNTNRHGKICYNNCWQPARFPEPCYLIFGQKAFESTESFVDPSTENGWLQIHAPQTFMSVAEEVEKGITVKAETIEELAEKIGLPAANLAKTVETYNANTTENADPEFLRGTEFFLSDDLSDTPAIEAFDLVPLEAPFYAFEIRPAVLNTCGGAKRLGDCNIVDTAGNRIPRLYGAGEFGSIYSYNYNGGGNVGESLATGRVAARSIAALEPWE